MNTPTTQTRGPAFRFSFPLFDAGPFIEHVPAHQVEALAAALRYHSIFDFRAEPEPPPPGTEPPLADAPPEPADALPITPDPPMYTFRFRPGLTDRHLAAALASDQAPRRGE